MGPISNLRELWNALLRKAWLIALILLVGLPLVAAFALSRPKIYEAISVIQIEVPDIAVTASGQIQGMTADAQINLITQNLMARDNILAQIERFDLFAELETQTERIAAMRESVVATKIVDPANAWRPDVQPSGLALAVRLDDPAKAAQLANALATQIVDETRNRTAGRATRTLEFLTGEESRVATAIADIEDRIAEYRATHLQSLPEGVTNQRDRLSRLSETRLALEQQAIELQSSRDRLRADDSVLQQTRLTNQIALVEQDIAEIEAALAEAPAVERNLSAMQRELSQLEAEFTVLTTQRTEAATAQLLTTQDSADRFVILELASEPEFPVSGSRRKLAIAGGLGVIMLAFGLALGLEVMNPAIRNSAQLEKAFGVQPAIVVPLLRNRRARLANRIGWIAVLVALFLIILYFSVQALAA